MNPTEQELFNQISKAVQENDDSKLSSIFAQESPEEEEQSEEETPAEEPELDTSDEDNEEQESSEQDDEEKEPEVVDPLEALRAEIAELKKAHQAVSSQVGRVPGLQRRVAEYDRQLAELRKGATSVNTSDKVKPKLDAALKDLEDTDPALAAAIRDAVGGTLSEVDTGAVAREEARLQALRDAEYSEYVNEQKTILLNKYPNVGDVFKSEHWNSWKKEQPRHILDLVSSDSADAVIMALDLYKKDMIAKYPELANAKQSESEQPVVDERASQIEESRKKQRQNAANLDSGKSPARPKGPVDADALFKKYSEEIRKEISGA